MGAEALRHRITVQRKVEVVDPDTGYREWTWVDRIVDEPANWKAGPGREYLASEAIRAEVTGRFEIRWSPEAAQILPFDRVLWDGRVMELKAPPLPDATARRMLILMVGSTDMDDAPPIPETYYLLTNLGGYLTTASGDRLVWRN